VFSRRKLIFSNDRVSWECGGAVWHEDSCDLDEQLPVRDLTILGHQSNRIQTIFSAREADIGDFTKVLGYFNDKLLTYPEDMSDAFAGIANALGDQYPGGFLFGLPVAFFSLALAWEPSETGSSRRFPSKVLDANAQSRLPSWSWIGWKGQNSFSMWESARLVGEESDDEGYLYYGDERRQCGFKPLVCWLAHTTQDDDGIAIEDFGIADGESVANAHYWAPGRLLRMLTNSETKSYRSSRYSSRGEYESEPCGICPYRCNAEWALECRHADVGAHRRFQELPHGNVGLISSRTRKSTVTLASPTELWDTHKLLENETGAVIGYLKVHIESATNPHEVLDLPPGSRMLIEVVEIAEIRISGVDGAFTHDHRGYYVCVMWVERRGNIAYRQGASGELSKTDGKSWSWNGSP
jgi:hypothetical protein